MPLTKLVSQISCLLPFVVIFSLQDALGPLYYAMRNGDMVIVTILLDNGADIFARAHVMFVM